MAPLFHLGLFLGLFFGFTQAVWASEALFHPEPRQLTYEVQAQHDYELTRYGDEGRREGDTLSVGGRIHYGFSDSWALSLGGRYGDGYLKESGIKTRSRGTEDLDLALQMGLSTEEGFFLSKLGFRQSLEDRELETSGDSNRATGGSWAELLLGYEWSQKPKVLGFSFRGLWGLGAREETSGTGVPIEVKGENELEFSYFYQRNFSEASFVGGQVGVFMKSDRDRNGVISDYVAPRLRLKLLGGRNMGVGQLLPHLILGTSWAETYAGTKLREFFEAQVGVRYRF